jgi:hypothetical protein
MPEGQGGTERTATRTPVQRDPKVTDLEGKSQYKDPFRGVNRLEAANRGIFEFYQARPKSAIRPTIDGHIGCLHTAVVADQLHLITLGVVYIQRAPVHPRMLGGFDLKAQRL